MTAGAARQRTGASEKLARWEQRATQQWFACLAATGRRADLEALMGRYQGAPEETHLRYYLGLTYALEARIDPALEHLRRVIAQAPDHAEARKLAYQLVLRQVRQKVRSGDWQAVSQAASLAVEVAPPGADPSRDLARWRSMLPVAYIRAGKRREAAQVWESQFREDPSDTRLLHNLAVLHYWWAAGEERNVSPASPPPWEAAVGYWTAMLHVDSYWKEFRQQRERAWGFPLPEQDLDAFRKNFLDEYFCKLFRNRASDSKEKNNTAEFRRQDEYLTSALLERKSAECWRQGLELLKKKLHPSGSAPWERSRLLALPGGFLFFERFGLLADVRAAISQLAAAAPDAECLPWLRVYFSADRLGRAAVLADERSKPEEALALLEKLPPAAKNSLEGMYVRGRGLARRAEMLFAKREVPAALQSWKAFFDLVKEALAKIAQERKRATEITGCGGGLAEAAVRDGLERMFQTLRQEVSKQVGQSAKDEALRLKSEEQLDKAIALLAQILEFCQEEVVKQHLCAFYCERGFTKLNKERYSEARDDFGRALKLDPQHQNARQGMSTTYNNEGVAKNDPNDAIPLFEKALEYNPNNHTARQNLNMVRAIRRQMRGY
jgi:tetratricopeptide (TPR) repeat protein